MMDVVRISRIAHHIARNWKFLNQSKFRRCKCCNKFSLIISLSAGDEYKICIRCGANLRYEMLRVAIDELKLNYETAVIVELDPDSPIKNNLRKAKHYIRTYYSPTAVPGTMRSDGAVCEDITSLTLKNDSVDLIISSDVLEHVPDIGAAFLESARVLKIGGWHLFTVPTRAATIMRAHVDVSGRLIFDVPAEYHSDPLNPHGILAFWDIGPDLLTKFKDHNYSLKIIAGPIGVDSRIIYGLQKINIKQQR